jgi:hypothetical protein
MFSRQRGVHALGDDLVVARLHLPGGDGDAGAARSRRLCRAAAEAGADGNPRLRRRELLGEILAGDMQCRRIPGNHQRRALVGEIGWLPQRRLDAVDRRDTLRNGVEPGEPRLPLGGMIALHPRFDRRQHAQRFLAANFIVPARAMVRRAGLPRGLEDVFAAEQKTRALRSADGLAAAVGDDRCPALQMHVGNGQDLGGRIDEDWNVPGASDARHRLERHGA